MMNAVPLLISAVVTLAVWRSFRGKTRTRWLMFEGLILSITLLLAACGIRSAQVIDELYAVAAGILPIIVAMGGALFPDEASAIKVGVADALASFSALKKVVDEYDAAPSDSILTKVQAAFTDIQTNLSALEVAAHVKDARAQAKILAIVQGIVLSLASLESSIFYHHPAEVAAKQAQATQQFES